MMEIIFYLCCGLIRVVSYLTGYSYEEVNTFLFIYLQPAILMVSGWLITVFAIKYYSHSTFNKFALLISPVYNLAFTIVVAAIWKHYLQFNMQAACERAYIDLDTLGRITGLGYVNINILLFIVLFLLILVFHIAVLYCQKKCYRNSLARQRSLTSYPQLRYDDNHAVRGTQIPVYA